MIELTTGLFLFISANGITASTTAMLPNAAHAEVKAPVITVTTTDAPLTLEMYVRDYFKDTPILAEISRCESRFKHYDKSGNLIRGDVTPADVGVMQINENYHSSTAKSLGMDLHTVDGNLAYAKYLYQKEGTAPWSASKPCWGKAKVADNQ